MSILSFLGISKAFAETAAPSTSGGFLSILPMLLILIFFMYFLIVRPQSKKAKELKNVIASLKKGDEVLTAGGIIGRIEKIADDFVSLALNDTVEIVVQKSSIVSCVPKGTIKSLA
jgi:preprotein translocase subunit YajC